MSAPDLRDGADEGTLAQCVVQLVQRLLPARVVGVGRDLREFADFGPLRRLPRCDIEVDGFELRGDGRPVALALALQCLLDVALGVCG
jgi:hypothetical protein